MRCRRWPSRRRAILHLPDMSHRPDSETLKSILPCVIKYAADWGLSRSSKPTAKALSRYGKPVLLVTVDNPAGEGLTEERRTRRFHADDPSLDSIYHRPRDASRVGKLAAHVVGL